jgi:hypothetical protein
MNFDLDNYDKYLQPTITEIAAKRINQLNGLINDEILSEGERKFINDVKRRIYSEKPITDKQKVWLAKIIKKCNDTSMMI